MLNPEREALWTRLESVSFLTDDEKRAAAGYAAKREAPAAVSAKYNENHDEAGLFSTPENAVPPKGERSRNSVRVAQVSDKPEPTKYKIYLQAEEARGGHTIDRHVARPDQELIEIVRRDRIDILGAVTIYRRQQGSFLSHEDAQDFVNRVIAANPERVQLVVSGLIKDDAIIKRFGYRTGKDAYRPAADVEPFIRPTFEVLVRIQTDQRSPNGFRVFSAYPINAKKPLAE